MVSSEAKVVVSGNRSSSFQSSVWVLASTEDSKAALRLDRRFSDPSGHEPTAKVAAARWRRIAQPMADPKESPLSAASIGEKRRADQLAAGLQASAYLDDGPLGIIEHVEAAIGEEKIRLLVCERQRAQISEGKLDAVQRPLLSASLSAL
jgi:hypothetical protein